MFSSPYCSLVPGEPLGYKESSALASCRRGNNSLLRACYKVGTCRFRPWRESDTGGHNAQGQLCLSQSSKSSFLSKGDFRSKMYSIWPEHFFPFDVGSLFSPDVRKCKALSGLGCALSPRPQKSWNHPKFSVVHYMRFPPSNTFASFFLARRLFLWASNSRQNDGYSFVGSSHI